MLLPEEPLKNACVGGMSVADNIAFREFDRAPFASSGWFLNRLGVPRRRREARSGFTRSRPAAPDTPIAALSGGNVQRAVLARELGGEVEVLIVANPCFGLDFAAVAQIHAEIMAARNRGAAVLLVSEDLDELLELSDRLVVMFHGKFVYEARAGRGRPHRNRPAHGRALMVGADGQLQSDPMTTKTVNLVSHPLVQHKLSLMREQGSIDQGLSRASERDRHAALL